MMTQWGVKALLSADLGVALYPLSHWTGNHLEYHHAPAAKGYLSFQCHWRALQLLVVC